MRTIPKMPTAVFATLLATALHVDWHLARPAHHRLSLEWPYHWAATASFFALVGWIIARRWPGIRWRLGLVAFAAAIVLAQGIEPMLEVLMYQHRLGYPDDAVRWAAFARAIVASAPAYFGALWLCVPQRPGRRVVSDVRM